MPGFSFMGDRCLPRICIKCKGDVLFCGSGPSLDIFSKRGRKKVNVFEEEGSHIFGLHLSERSVLAYGEHNLAVFAYPKNEQGVVLTDKNFFRFSDSILEVSLLSDDQLVVLFTCNNIVRFHAQTVSNSISLLKLEEIQSDHVAVLLNGLLLGDSWVNLISVVGTVFGEILISKPADGSVIQRKLKGHTGMIFGLLQFGNFLCSISDDRSLRIWDFDSNAPLSGGNVEIDCQYGHAARPFAICSDERHGFIYTSGIDQIVCKWSFDSISGKLRLNESFAVNIGCVRSLAIHEDRLYIGSENGGLLAVRTRNFLPLDSQVLEACDDIRGFALASSKSIYTVDGRGRIYCDNVLCWSELDVLRYLVSPPDHCDQSFALAYGDKKIVTLAGGVVSKFADMESRILSVVCTDRYIFVHTVQQNGYLYDYSGPLLCCFSMKSISALMKKKNAMIPSTMNVMAVSDKQYLVVGTTSGHLLFAPIRSGDEVVEFTSKSEMTRQFKNCHIMSICSEKLVLTVLCKNGEVSKWKLTEDDYFVHISSSSASDCVSLDWPCSIYRYEGKKYIGGFHSTNFHLVDASSRLCVLTIPCGGGNRSWHFKIETVNGSPSGKMLFIRDQLLVSASCVLDDFEIISHSLHRSQIVSIHNLGETDLFCTFGTDNQLVITRLSTEGKYKEINVLKRIADHVGFISIDSFVNCSNNVIFVTGGNKGFVTMWELKYATGGQFEDDSLIEIVKFQHKSCTRVIYVQYLRDTTGEVVQPLVISALYADGSIDILKIDDYSVGFVCLTTLLPPDLSLFTKAQFFKFHDGRKLLILVSTSGCFSVYELLDTQLLIRHSVSASKCGIACLHSLIVGTNVFAAVGTEAGDVQLLRMSGEDVSLLGTVQYHAATVTALELRYCQEGFTLLSTSLDCRLAQHAVKFTEDSYTIAFAKSRCLSVWDPSSFISTGNHLVLVGAGVEVLEDY